MAIPRSEDKKRAILEAATKVVAAQGLAASTAQIAKGAGVAEGTLFRYFPTKDTLLNELFADLTRDLGESIMGGYDPGADLKARTQMLWNNYIDWGIANPAGYSAMAQLAVSEKIHPEVRDQGVELCRDVRGVINACDFGGIGATASAEFAEAILSAIAQVTIASATRSPSATEAYKQAGFAIMWAGLARE